MKTTIFIPLCLTLLSAPHAFCQKETKDGRENLLKAAINSNPFQYSIQQVEINTQYSEYGPVFYLNNLVFTSGRRNLAKTQLKYKNSGDYLTDLYVAQLHDNFPVNSKAFPMPRVKLNEATATFTPDGKTMYFTQNNSKTNSKGKKTLKICRATLIGDKWKNVTDLPFNSIDFNTANPALSPDGTTLYFSSDRPGTLGDTDIFKVTINNDGTFTNPENLGNKINTPQRDSFPFVSEDNILYFASLGHKGYGGLDIFTSKIQNDETFGPVVNMGDQINSSKDDFSLVINSKERIGFFASNRENGKGSDDIYRFTQIKREELPADQQTTPQAPIADAAKQKADSIRQDSILHKEQSIASQGTKTKPMELKAKKVYFAFGRSQLDPDNAQTQKALQAIAEMASRNPDIMFTIEGHADNIGKEKPNVVLSKKRAKNVEAQLIKIGIPKESIAHVKGYGESKPAKSNKSANGRSLNRRVEIIPVINKKQ